MDRACSPKQDNPSCHREVLKKGLGYGSELLLAAFMAYWLSRQVMECDPDEKIQNNVSVSRPHSLVVPYINKLDSFFQCWSHARKRRQQKSRRKARQPYKKTLKTYVLCCPINLDAFTICA